MENKIIKKIPLSTIVVMIMFSMFMVFALNTVKYELTKQYDCKNVTFQTDKITIEEKCQIYNRNLELNDYIILLILFMVMLVLFLFIITSH